ncbi:MAG: T9SS type A sorting domain-containing protein [Flavobacteriales bacterium]|nr:T9SS type A sorting domain-containing protein [Flavobacteriales bacterium]
MAHRYSTVLLAASVTTCVQAQILIDSIPLPGISQGFWGIHVTPDTIFLGADFNGNVYCFDHDGAELSTEPTGFTFNHGLIKTSVSHMLAQDYTTNGAHLYEVSFVGGTLLNSWTFPDVIGGPSSGIGDLCSDGNAVWYTMYYPDFDVYPYAYAYKWIPGDLAPIDTVPMQGEQPYGIALKGDTLFYVTDNLNGDLERIYAYDLTNDQLLGSIALPDPDNDQSPRGLFYDGTNLYVVANRVGGAAFAYQTIFIYGFDTSTGIEPVTERQGPGVHPSPANERAWIDGLAVGERIELIDRTGRLILQEISTGSVHVLELSATPAGAYFLRMTSKEGIIRAGKLIIAH